MILEEEFDRPGGVTSDSALGDWALSLRSRIGCAAHSSVSGADVVLERRLVSRNTGRWVPVGGKPPQATALAPGSRRFQPALQRLWY